MHTQRPTVNVCVHVWASQTLTELEQACSPISTVFSNDLKPSICPFIIHLAILAEISWRETKAHLKVSTYV